jgi:8-oxo-dGTP diphosphatase
MSKRYRLIAAVYLILIRDGKILLSRRFNTGFKDGSYSLPAGHLEIGEKVKDGMIREAQEEIAVILEAEDLKVVHTMLRKKEEGEDDDRIDFFLTAENFAGEPKNMEPEKCGDLSWFPIEDLPPNALPYIRQAIDAVRRGQTFSEFGWN